MILTKKEKDIFDRIMSCKIFSPLEPFYKKNKMMLLYLFFGGLTTVISFVSYWLAAKININDMTVLGYSFNARIVLANVISWICAVTFSYVTNRIWVFDSNVTTKKGLFREMAAFYGGRVFTLLVETLMIYAGVKLMNLNEMVMKIIASVVVLILNYIISKLVVFKKTKADA